MKLFLSLLALLAGLCAASAHAQPGLSHYDAARLAQPDAQALAFIRIPLGHRAEPKNTVIGFGLFADCSRVSAQQSAAQRIACEAESVRSVEFSRKVYARDWLLSFTGEKRWVGIARWYPDSGFARVREFGPVLSAPRLESEKD